MSLRSPQPQGGKLAQTSPRPLDPRSVSMTTTRLCRAASWPNGPAIGRAKACRTRIVRTETILGTLKPDWSSRNHRKGDAGRVLGVVKDRLLGDLALALEADAAAGVEIAVVAREVAGRDFDPDAVTLLEEVRGRPQVDLEFGRRV